MDETKVHYGIAKAHQIMQRVNSYIESEDLTSLSYLLSWKENRGSIVCDPTKGKTSVFENSLVFVSFLMVPSVIFILLVILTLFMPYYINIGCSFTLYCIFDDKESIKCSND